MFKKSTIALAVSTCFLLTGCLEVEDNSNDDLISAIENQNNSAQEAETATLSGSVKNVVSDSLVANAQIQIKVGNTWSEPVALANGLFELSNVPTYSDYTLLITSTDDSFQERAFYGSTGLGISQLGTLLVTSTETVEFAALLDAENTPIKDLQFSYSTSSGVNDSTWQSRNEHFISASYNNETNLYSIEKPIGWDYPITVDMDVDNDNVNEYKFTLGYHYDSTILFSELNDSSTILFDTADDVIEYQLRVKVINDLGQIFKDIELVASSNDFEANPLTFDESTNEYVYDFIGSSSLNVMLSAFIDENEQSYLSDSFVVAEDGDNITVGGLYSQGNFSVENNVVSVVFKPEKGTETTQVDLISNTYNQETNGYYLFFTKPVELTDESITLTKNETLSVIPGSESDADSVPVGSTFFKFIDKEFETTSKMSLNDTFVEVLPNQTLDIGSYSYTLSSVIDKETQLPSRNSLRTSFLVSDKTEFSISDIRIDNNNGLKSGELIHLTNTAGESASFSSKSNEAMLYLPSSIVSLSDLSITVTGYTNNGNKYPYYQEYNIVSEEQFYGGDLVHLASTAINETVYGDTNNVILHTSLPDSMMYRRSIGWNISRLNDNQSNSVNAVSLEYEYKVKGSKDVITGTATLPVL